MPADTSQISATAARVPVSRRRRSDAVPFAIDVSARDEIADAAHRLDQRGGELLAQVVDMHLDRVRLDFLASGIESRFEMLAREHTPGVEQQIV